jgi:hypothetical protein
MSGVRRHTNRAQDQRTVSSTDNESGKGDHGHVRGRESSYRFVSPDKLIEDFLREARRADDEDRDA